METMGIMETVDTKMVDMVFKLPVNEREKWWAENDCIYFGEKYIKSYDIKWTSKTAPLHYELIDSILEYERLQVHVPFEHAKTTWISIVFPLWQIIKDTNVQILLLSSTPKLVRKCLSVISWHLLNNKQLLEDFPYLKKNEELEKWTDDQIYLDRDSVSKDPTIEVVGAGGDILGGRHDFIISDDLCNRKNTNTLALRDKMDDWWKNDVTSRVVEGGHIANIGTMQHKDDQGNRLAKRKPYHYIKKKAIIDEAKGIVLWKDKSPIEALIKRREEVGTLVFERSWQSNIKALEGCILKPEWLHYYREDEINENNLRIYFGVDPDIAEEGIDIIELAKHDYFVIAVLGWDSIKNIIYVLDIYYNVLSFPQQVSKIVAYYNIHKPVKILVEDNYYQKALKQQLFLQGLPVMGVTSSKAKPIRLESRSTDYESGRILILKSQHELISEFINYGDEDYKLDCLDAIDIGCRGIPTTRIDQVVTGGVM